MSYFKTNFAPVPVAVGICVIGISTVASVLLLRRKKTIKPVTVKFCLKDSDGDEKIKRKNVIYKWIEHICMLPKVGRLYVGLILSHGVSNVRLRIEDDGMVDLMLDVDRHNMSPQDLRKMFGRFRYTVHYQQKFTLCRKVVDKKTLDKSFAVVAKEHEEMELPRYSRYSNWSQSCYLEVDPTYVPKVGTKEPLRLALEQVLLAVKERFSDWYCWCNGLEEVEVITMNSFVTKYICVEGKEEFGKHVDGIKIDGSAVLALPTTDDHDWPGLQIWDKDKRSFVYKLNPGDACFIEKMVWHRGLPITKGVRYVLVCFYKCNWKKVKLTV